MSTRIKIEICEMMDIDAIRRRNLDVAIKIAGSQKILAQKILEAEDKEASDTNIRNLSSYISQIAKETKACTRKFCARIEAALSLKDGWMDSNHSAVATDNANADLVKLMAKMERFSKEDQEHIWNIIDSVYQKYELMDQFAKRQ